MQKLLLPIILLIFTGTIILIFQFSFPIFLDLFDDLYKLVEKKISSEVWPLLLAMKILIVPFIISAATIRTFCRYIHDSRRNIAKTHFKSVLMYLLSISFIAAFFSVFNYLLLLYSNNPGNILFFVSKKQLSIIESKYVLNLMFVFTLFVNSLAYIVSTYLVESGEMRRINKINDMGPLMLDSSYISHNIAIVGVTTLVYLVSIALYTNSFLIYLENIKMLSQPLVFILLFATAAHLIFAGLYMKYTNIPIRFAPISAEEKEST